jgi:hypothetical protein
MSIADVMPDFVESFENKDTTCTNMLVMLSDEDLHPIFHDTIGMGDCPGFPVWYREHIADRLLERFPFIYEQTQHTLSITIERILYRRGGGMKFDDLCVEFMALHQGILSELEKKTYGSVLSHVVTSSPEELRVLYYEGPYSHEMFVGRALSEKNRKLVTKNDQITI